MTRRRLIGSTAVVAGVAAVPFASASPAMAASSVDEAFDALAAFTVPGNDAYSKQQRVSTSRPGGVENGGGKVVQNVLDAGVPVVIAELSISAPGALAFSLVLRYFALKEDFGGSFGPFGHPFANLTWEKKRNVLDAIDRSTVFTGTPIAYSANALATLAALGGFSEGRFLRRNPNGLNTLTAEPVGYQLSKYQGVSDGHPEFIGYYQNRTEVTG